VAGTALARIRTLSYDSRDRLLSEEQHLAALGMTWATDAAYDAHLAEELARSRLQRDAGVATATPADAVEAPSAVRARLRWSSGMLLIRAGQRLQGAQPMEAV
jgi:hypothetical protein